MQTFDVAHLYEQGQNIIMVLVGQQPTNRQCNALQMYASRAGLAGTVVPVWPQSFGGFGYLAPIQWHPYFRSLSWEDILMNVNRQLTCY